jgi:heme exporter protein A
LPVLTSALYDMAAMTAPEALPPPELTIETLAVSRGGRVLFSDLSFALHPGGATALRGPNGAGKTSLLLAVAGALRPESGTIRYRVRGETLDRAPHIHLFLTQNATKPRLSLAENLAFWRDLNGTTGLAVPAALERVGLGGLEDIEAGGTSTGQQRRLALARLLVSRRTVWLLDEPTASLDTAGETLVAKLIREHCGAGGMALVATHHALDLPGDGTGPREILVRDGAAVIDPGPKP